ncbi:hypothetical protein V8D89_007992 [Ganoderma adspersum]
MKYREHCLQNALRSVNNFEQKSTNRGIGLEIPKQLLQSPNNIVLAACRDPSKADALQALAASAGGRLHVLRLDVSDAQSITDAASEAAKIVGDKGIDYLINNAGINPGGLDTGFAFKAADFTTVFETNVVGPALLSLVETRKGGGKKKKTVVNVSSTVGGAGAGVDHFGGICATYAVSKAALNMLTAKDRADLIVVSVCPGHLQTDMGGPDAATPVSVGVSGLIKLAGSLTPQDSGAFLNLQGERIPWCGRQGWRSGYHIQPI